MAADEVGNARVTDGVLAGRTAVVTGGANGIGLAISRRLARDGARVAIYDLDADAAKAAAEEIAGTGARATGHAVDVTRRDQIEAATERVRKDFGPIGILVNNAGIECFGAFLELDDATLRQVYEVNVFGTFYCTQAIVPDMIEVGWGRVVNISSSSAQRGSAKMSAYSSSKGAIISFTRSLALELAPHGITVNNIPPNFIVTPMLHKSIEAGHFPPDMIERGTRETPVGRAGAPEDIAAACAFLASPDASYVTAQTFGVNGGRFP